MKQVRCISSLNKVFPWEAPEFDLEELEITAFQNEVLSLQFAYCGEGEAPYEVQLRVQSELANKASIRSVELMPSRYPCGTETDDNYIDTKAGMYPDLLRKTEDGMVHVIPGCWHSAWLELALDESVPAGTYPLRVSMIEEDGREVAYSEQDIHIYEGTLKKQELIHTEWFHADCLADYYQVPVWSKEHWNILEQFLSVYQKRGMNMILTPIITPPLDIAEDGDRTTAQLVEIVAQSDGDDQGSYRYQFDFTKLVKWIGMCRSHGIEYFEMAHLYSQWGARYIPKIMALVDGRRERLFPRKAPAVSKAYQTFLAAFLPALIAVLREEGLEGKVFFHLSDEPSEEDLERYLAVKEQTEGYLDGFPIIDALSRYAFYENGAIKHPIPGTNHIMDFVEKGVPHLWTYYCSAQKVDVSNRFFAMPLSRTRVLGLQLYKYGMEGFLHWGFNFYNTRFSLAHIDPYAVTDAGANFPSGDSFVVYPGEDGRPEESIRLMALMEAVQDYRACRTLEEYISREEVVRMIEADLKEPLTFCKYPKTGEYILKVRERINHKIDEYRNGVRHDREECEYYQYHKFYE